MEHVFQSLFLCRRSSRISFFAQHHPQEATKRTASVFNRWRINHSPNHPLPPPGRRTAASLPPLSCSWTLLWFCCRCGWSRRSRPSLTCSCGQRARRLRGMPDGAEGVYRGTWRIGTTEGWGAGDEEITVEKNCWRKSKKQPNCHITAISLWMPEFT